MILCISIIPEVVYILEAGEQMKIQAKEKIHMIPINYVFFFDCITNQFLVSHDSYFRKFDIVCRRLECFQRSPLPTKKTAFEEWRSPQAYYLWGQELLVTVILIWELKF